MDFRIGHGFDMHRLVPERDLWLGGVQIPFHLGLLGHSDADVLIHAVCDAILGALAAGDIGELFPDDDPLYENIDSKILLEKVQSLMQAKGWKLSNLDATLIMQKPKIAQYISEIRKTLAGILQIDINNVSVKATTTEGMGPEGREEGISAHAVVLIGKNR
jgi:2-C-methyl-D-erythritol 2,4-cyclodiphosphate synthase